MSRRKIWSPKIVIEDGKEPRWAIEGEDLEKMDFVVCMPLAPSLILPDNKVGSCNDCGIAVQHRPDISRKQRKLCLDCFGIRRSGGNA